MGKIEKITINNVFNVFFSNIYLINLFTELSKRNKELNNPAAIWKNMFILPGSKYA